jgi:hypothetical protein
MVRLYPKRLPEVCGRRSIGGYGVVAHALLRAAFTLV